MIFDPYFAWLGFRLRKPVAGLHITSDFLTLVAIRPRPARLVAIGRLAIPDAAVVGDEIRLIEPLIAGLRQLVEETRLGPGMPTVVTIEPLADTTTVWDDGSNEETHQVADSTFERSREVVAGAGLGLVGVDLVPAALARVGRLTDGPPVALRSPTGWTVVAVEGRADADRKDRDADPALQMGPDLSRLAPVAGVPGIGVPDELRDLLDPGRDAPAIGAALAALGRPPLVAAQPTVQPVGTSWTVQQIPRIAPVESLNSADWSETPDWPNSPDRPETPSPSEAPNRPSRSSSEPEDQTYATANGLWMEGLSR